MAKKPERRFKVVADNRKARFNYAIGETFEAGRLGEYEITKDPTRPDVDALRVLMGPFTVYTAENVEEGA